MLSITVIGRRWFDRPNGNTYHSVRVIVDGEEVVVIPFAYGYGDYYAQTAWEALKEKGLIEVADTWPRIYCEKRGIAYTCEVSDVARRKDLHNGGREDG